MTRKYPTTMINVTREDTERADYYRERAKPVQETPKPAPASEPAPAPAPEVLAQPKPGRGRALKIVTPSPIPAGSVVMAPSQARALRNMVTLAAQTTTDPATRARLNRAHNEVVRATRGMTL